MVSRMILGSTKEKRDEYVSSTCDTEKISLLDRVFVEKESGEDKPTKQSIGIEDIKQIQKTLYLTPVQSKQKAIIISSGELLTTEAQNALLKVLEEPPDHTLFFICAQTSEALLPTIRSRCQLIKLSDETRVLGGEDEKMYKQLLQELQKKSISHPFQLAETCKTKLDAVLFLENILLIARNHMDENGKETSHMMKDLWETYKAIKSTNASHRLLLETLFLRYTKN